MATNGCRTDPAASYWLDDEQRARVRDCLTKECLSLTQVHFAGLVRGIESSIGHFLATEPQGSFRDAHDALRQLWEWSHDEDPPIGLLRVRLSDLPNEAREYIGGRAPRVISALLGETIAAGPFESSERTYKRFLDWVRVADGSKLVRAIQVLSGDGGRIVEGRSRGPEKRSGPRVEPEIMGEVRGTGSVRHRGGRPTNERHQMLVVQLANDWLNGTGEPPKRGRSDGTGFGDLVHSVFQWLTLAEESAAYALRQYWDTVKAFKAREPLEDFLRRHGEEL
jgi:hypothetical protein